MDEVGNCCIGYYRAALGWVFEHRGSLSLFRRKILRIWLKIMKEEAMTEEPITYKGFYNKDRGLPEPVWGSKVEEPVIQCPTCGSTDMYYSGSADNPEEMFGAEGSVRCKHCGHISDWFEALKQREHHPTDTPREVIRNGVIPLAPAVYCPKDGRKVPIWYCLGSVTQGRELCLHLVRATVHGGESAEVECKWKG